MNDLDDMVQERLICSGCLMPPNLGLAQTQASWERSGNARLCGGLAYDHLPLMVSEQKGGYDREYIGVGTDKRISRTSCQRRYLEYCDAYICGVSRWDRSGTITRYQCEDKAGGHFKPTCSSFNNDMDNCAKYYGCVPSLGGDRCMEIPPKECEDPRRRAPPPAIFGSTSYVPGDYEPTVVEEPPFQCVSVMVAVKLSSSSASAGKVEYRIDGECLLNSNTGSSPRCGPLGHHWMSEFCLMPGAHSLKYSYDGEGGGTIQIAGYTMPNFLFVGYNTIDFFIGGAPSADDVQKTCDDTRAYTVEAGIELFVSVLSVGFTVANGWGYRARDGQCVDNNQFFEICGCAAISRSNPVGLEDLSNIGKTVADEMKDFTPAKAKKLLTDNGGAMATMALGYWGSTDYIPGYSMVSGREYCLLFGCASTGQVSTLKGDDLPELDVPGAGVILEMGLQFMGKWEGFNIDDYTCICRAFPDGLAPFDEGTIGMRDWKVQN